MALYLRKPELEEALDKYESKVDALDTKLLKYSDNSQKIINRLEKREKDMLKRLFGNEIKTKEALRQKLAQIKKSAPELDRLGGYALRQTVTLYRAKDRDTRAMENIEFQNYLFEAWDTWQPDMGKDKTVENFIISIVNQTYESMPTITIGQEESSGRVRALPSLRKYGGDRNNLSKVFLTDLAKVTQSRIREFLRNNKINVSKENKGKISSNPVTINYNDSSISVLDWYSITNGGKASQQIFSEEEAIRLLNKFKESFIEYLSGFNGAKEAVEEAFSKFSTDPIAAAKQFFIGSNYQNITGLCNEIRALIYLYILLGSGGFKNVTFLAKELSNGKQFHSDIALLEKFGMQVKGSLDEAFPIPVDFADSNIMTFLKKVKMSSANLKAIQGIIEAYVFNIPYRNFTFGTDRKNASSDERFSDQDSSYATVIPDSNPKFESTRNRIDLLFTMLEFVLTYYVAELMYIGIGNATLNENANIIFLIGDQFIFASEIIKDVLDNIYKETQHFNIQIKPNSSFTIVNYLRAEGLGNVFNSRKNVKYINDSRIIDSTILTSSYNFSSLLKEK